MAKICPYVFFQLLDDNGEPLSGGKLYTYEAGTSTPKATYTSSDESAANANPIILDSSGRADVWLESGAYKFVIDDSNDVLVEEVDNIVGDASNVFGATVTDVASNLTVNEVYQNNILNCTAAVTLSLLDVATAEEGFLFVVKNVSGGSVIIDPDGAETIDGLSTLTILDTYSVMIICDGTKWRSYFYTEVPTEFSDSTFRIQDNGDATKEIAFEASSITTGTTRTVTVPDANGTLLYVGDVLDEDDFSSDSAVYPPSQQSTKAYVDAEILANRNGWVEYATGTISEDDTTVDFAYPDSGYHYRTTIYWEQKTATTTLALNVTDDNFTSIENGATDYSYSRTYNGTVEVSTGTTSYNPLTTFSWKTAENNWMEITALDPQGSKVNPILTDSMVTNTSNQNVIGVSRGQYQVAAVYNGIRFTMGAAMQTGTWVTERKVI